MTTTISSTSQFPKVISLNMDWYSWLSKSSLEPSLVYDYSLLFTQNELEQEDIAHFNHDFLKSMGISIAKHRLEILKLAKKYQRRAPQPVASLLAAVKKTKKCFSNYMHSLVARHKDSSAIVVVRRPMMHDDSGGGGGGGRWRGAMLRSRKKRVVVVNGKQGKLMITDGCGARVVKKVGGNSVSHSVSPLVFRCGGGDEEEDEFWGNGVEEEMRWDSMFHNLKPT